MGQSQLLLIRSEASASSPLDNRSSRGQTPPTLELAALVQVTPPSAENEMKRRLLHMVMRHVLMTRPSERTSMLFGRADPGDAASRPRRVVPAPAVLGALGERRHLRVDVDARRVLPVTPVVPRCTGRAHIAHPLQGVGALPCADAGRVGGLGIKRGEQPAARKQKPHHRDLAVHPQPRVGRVLWTSVATPGGVPVKTALWLPTNRRHPATPSGTERRVGHCAAVAVVADDDRAEPPRPAPAMCPAGSSAPVVAYPSKQPEDP